jgi:hypothetical protein
VLLVLRTAVRDCGGYLYCRDSVLVEATFIWQAHAENIMPCAVFETLC